MIAQLTQLKDKFAFLQMAITKLTIQEFLQMAVKYPVLDVRSPGEFKHAYIHDYVNICEEYFKGDERSFAGGMRENSEILKSKVYFSLEGICKL